MHPTKEEFDRVHNTIQQWLNGRPLGRPNWSLEMARICFHHISQTEQCWLWTGSRDKRGYGRFSLTGGKQVFAHRLMYAAFVGPVTAGLGVCHCCDNPSCVRPDHLFIGTQRDNMRDCASKGRLGAQRFMRENPGVRLCFIKSKLSTDNVIEIRKRLASGERVRVLANMFRVHKSTIERIRNGERWANG